MPTNPITKIIGPDGKTYDIEAQYDSNGNVISSTYQKKSDPLKEVIDSHPENGGAVFAYYANDLIYAIGRGATVTLYNKTTDKTATNSLTALFDGTPSYYYSPSGFLSSASDYVLLTIDFSTMDGKTDFSFSWGNQIGIGFGASTWRAKSVTLELGKKQDGKIYWIEKGRKTNNAEGVVNFSASGPGANETAYAEDGTTISGASGSKYNAIRFTLTDWNSLNPRIAQAWIINYSSKGLANNFLQRTGGSVYGKIYPNKNLGSDLGDSSHKFDDVYANSFHGSLDGNASSATKATSADSATSATNDSQGNLIASQTWVKAQNYTTPAEATSYAQAAIDEQKGGPNGLALLNSNGKVLSSQLPSFVDDVQQFWYVVANADETKKNNYNPVIFYGLNETSHKSLNDRLPEGSLCPHVGDAIVFGYYAIDSTNPLGFPSSIPTTNGFITAYITLTDENGDHWKGTFSFEPTNCRSARIASVNTSAYSFTLSASEPYDLAEGKIYVEIYTNKTYRYSKNATISKLVEISESLALGSTSGTAFDGARGQFLEATVNEILSGSLAVNKAKKVTHPLTLNGTAYDGSKAIDITVADISYLGEKFTYQATKTNVSLNSGNTTIHVNIYIYSNKGRTKFVYDIIQVHGSDDKFTLTRKPIKISLMTLGTFWYTVFPNYINLYQLFEFSMKRAILLSHNFGLFTNDGDCFSFNGNGMAVAYMQEDLHSPASGVDVCPALIIQAFELDTENANTDLYLDHLYVRLYAEKA